MDDEILGPERGERVHRCGFVTLVGQPNVGKSTLLNRILGEKVAITSARPQTTRNRIPGVMSRADVQMVFVDTPGLHRANRALNEFMVDVAHDALWDTDAVALLVEAGMGPDGTVGISEIVRELLEKFGESNRPIFLVLNKIDLLDRDTLLPIIEAWSAAYDFQAIIPLSALKGEGTERLIEALVGVMPEGPALYPDDYLTDLPERFIGSELIREQLFRMLQQELPYSVAVTIEAWREKPSADRVDIEATIHVERDSQKGIVIGKGGTMLKTVGIRARKSLERLLGAHVNLRLFVRVEKGWTRSSTGMKKLGYSE